MQVLDQQHERGQTGQDGCKHLERNFGSGLLEVELLEAALSPRRQTLGLRQQPKQCRDWPVGPNNQVTARGQAQHLERRV